MYYFIPGWLSCPLYVKGITLDEYIRNEGPLSEKSATEIGLQICGIFDYLHNNKPSPIIYRDLKPANLVMTETGLVKLIDLDSIRQYKQETKKDTVFIGTEGFAAPEQFGFGQTDNRTDIFTLGTTLYFLLTGKMPVIERLRIKPVKEVRNDISKGLSRIIEKCTMFNPESRYQSVNELQSDFLELSSWTFKGLIKQSKLAITFLLIGIVAVLSFVVLNGYLSHEKVVSPAASNSNDAEAAQATESFFDKTTILEAFWSGEVPKKLPIEFVQAYKQGNLYKYDPSVFFIAIKEWDPNIDFEQMTHRIDQAGGKLLLRAEGYMDVLVEMNSDSMTSGDGTGQMYLAYVRNDKDLVSGVRYRLIDNTGHWITEDDVYVERPKK